MHTIVQAASVGAEPQRLGLFSTPSDRGHSAGRKSVKLRARTAIALSLQCLLLAGCAHTEYAVRHTAADPYAVDYRAVEERLAAARPYWVARPFIERENVAAARKRSEQAVAARNAARGPAMAQTRTETVAANVVVPTSARTTSVPLDSPAAPAARLAGPPADSNGIATQQLIEQGRALFQSGQVLKARERYLAAMIARVPGRLPDVLPELARTYDPHYLGQLRKSDVQPNAGMAIAIYQRAASVGSKAVDADLERLEKLPR